MSIIAVAATLMVGQANPSINSVLQTQLKDATFTWKKSKADQRELNKINKDFAQSYRFKDVTVWMREPFMMRLESVVDDMKVYFIMNGATKVYKIPQAKISHKESVAKAPGKRQTVFDFGILTPALMQNFLEAKYIRTERATGEYVFDMTYEESLDDTTRHRVWIDPAKKFITKREWYSQNGGHLMATFLYDNEKKFGSVWIPTRLSVKNAENKVAGVSDFTNMKVNIGIESNLFSVN